MSNLFFKTLLFAILFSQSTFAEDIQTNGAIFKSPPKWFKRVKAEKVIDRVQSKLEWSLRRIPVEFYTDQKIFEKKHHLGPTPSAVTIKTSQGQSIHLGPEVKVDNFDSIFAHELVHVIFAQKYQGAIPRWLEEGFANHLSKTKPVNYTWLKQQNLPMDVTTLTHPYKGRPENIRTHYMTSQALVEMLDKKCDLENLIRLSVERKMEDYIKTFCEIKNINSTFKDWLKSKN